jgi:hypothetical protein
MLNAHYSFIISSHLIFSYFEFLALEKDTFYFFLVLKFELFFEYVTKLSISLIIYNILPILSSNEISKTVCYSLIYEHSSLIITDSIGSNHIMSSILKWKALFLIYGIANLIESLLVEYNLLKLVQLLQNIFIRICLPWLKRHQ